MIYLRLEREETFEEGNLHHKDASKHIYVDVIIVFSVLPKIRLLSLKNILLR